MTEQIPINEVNQDLIPWPDGNPKCGEEGEGEEGEEGEKCKSYITAPKGLFQWVIGVTWWGLLLVSIFICIDTRNTRYMSTCLVSSIPCRSIWRSICRSSLLPSPCLMINILVSSWRLFIMWLLAVLSSRESVLTRPTTWCEMGVVSSLLVLWNLVQRLEWAGQGTV